MNSGKDSIPAWLGDVVETACNSFELSVPGHIGWHAVPDESSWEVWVYPMPVEFVGGAGDGDRGVPGQPFAQLSEVLRLFDEAPHEVDFCQFTDGIPEVSIEGRVLGHDVWLHILQQPPDDVEPETTYDVRTGVLSEKTSD